MTSNEIPCPEPGDCSDLASACTGKLHPMALLGLALFNQRQYWKAHEALEEAWKLEPGPVRHMYRGILQVGVAYLHLQQNNLTGALKMYDRCQRWLIPFPPVCRGVNLAQLRADLDAAITEARRLGPGAASRLRPEFFKPIEYTAPPSRHHAG